jgi:streptogramin lyase
LDRIGAGQDQPFEPDEDNSEGVRMDEEMGGLVLDSTSINTNLIWVANTGEGSVSKVDVRTFVELGRYSTGYDPSRTSVNTAGDVYVGNRNGFSLTKISALGAECPDTNGDGEVTTSSGHDVLPWGQDDCVLWRTDLTGCGVIRAVAAQDVIGPDGSVHPYVWVGGFNGCVWKLDGITGEILINATPVRARPYGFALDGQGQLWIHHHNTHVGRLDTRRCVDDASCAVDICDDTGDGCVKQQIALPAGTTGYGITVDWRQRVWLGGGAGPIRYDPMAPAGQRWALSGANHFVHGIAADSNGWIWGAGGGQVVRVNGDDPTQWTFVAGAAGFSAKGAAVDADGKVWMINISHHNATVIIPGATLNEAEVRPNVSPFFRSPYTYSDMTGLQLRWATQPRGHYRAIFSGCNNADTIWQDINFSGQVPDHTWVRFRARVADSAEELQNSPWILVGESREHGDTLSLADALLMAEDATGGFLEIELQLFSEVTDAEFTRTPLIYDLAATHSCREILI